MFHAVVSLRPSCEVVTNSSHTTSITVRARCMYRHLTIELDLARRTHKHTSTHTLQIADRRRSPRLHSSVRWQLTLCEPRVRGTAVWIRNPEVAPIMYL